MTYTNDDIGIVEWALDRLPREEVIAEAWQRLRSRLMDDVDWEGVAADQAPPAAGASANVTPMRQPRADLARLVESINAAVYANGDGLSVTEAIGALELAKLELLKEQER